MRNKTSALIAAAVVLGLLVPSAIAGGEPKPLPRSVYIPIAFSLCEHLENAILYQDDIPVSTMPSKRVFQFTYYPELERMLPETVQIRVEGTYAEKDEPFVARLAVTAEGVHTAHRTRTLDTVEQVKKQGHKIDVRLDQRQFRLDCPRYCSKSKAVASK